MSTENTLKIKIAEEIESQKLDFVIEVRTHF